MIFDNSLRIFRATSALRLASARLPFVSYAGVDFILAMQALPASVFGPVFAAPWFQNIDFPVNPAFR